MPQSAYRKTTQHLAPAVRPKTPLGTYDIYPAYPLAGATVGRGHADLAALLAGHETVILDGAEGILWDDLRDALQAAGLPHQWVRVTDALKPMEENAALVEPYLGGDDPIFGRRFEGELLDFFDRERLAALPRPEGPVVLFGPGASLAGWDGYLAFLDLPKNELQFRQRALAARDPGYPLVDAKRAYKRSYFVAWPALRKHMASILPRLDLVIDAQRASDPTFVAGGAFRQGLRAMSTTSFRARPWFEPGPWGGQWIRERIPGLAEDVPNYAWSFELISPENGIAFADGEDRVLEVSFDWLMASEGERVLGEAWERFGTEFPIRFDFLDTVRGGNLSVQCHPRPEYIRRHFGESFTQDETYYILDCEPGATVYLGFQEGIDRNEFRAALEGSFREGTSVEVERFVQVHPAEKHDLFLIPNGTIHCSGVGSLVLEISATPYIFTFKMYDWLRLDLEGKPRPLNIERAFENLYFERQGERVQRELISRPSVVGEGEGWRVVHLPTHEEHFYDVQRLEFDRQIEQDTDGAAHVMNLVEGEAVEVEAGGLKQRFNYAETFIVPAAAGHYRITNLGQSTAKVVQSYVKPGRGPR